MKHTLKYISSFVVGSMLLVSCTKEVNQDPVYTLDGSRRFNTIDDYEFALTGAYTQFLANSYYGSTNGANAFVALPDMMSDNLFETSESLANYTQFANWNYTADDNLVEDIWLDAYAVIRQANLTMRGIDKFAGSNTGAVNRIKGQALAIRALAHFDLLRYFGEEYARNSTKLGIPYVESFDVEAKPARLTVRASLDKIEADLKAAKAAMANMDRAIQANTNTSSARGNIDAIVVDAILARMYNYAGVHDSAVKYATLVINARPLATPAEFPQIWKDATTKEVVWSVKFQAFNSDIGGNVYYAVGNRASYRATNNLLATFNATPSDIRTPAYFTQVARRGANRLVVSKYIGREGRTDGIVDFKAFRTAEMYLIRAEAYYNLARPADALIDLNTLRAARGVAAGAETGTALFDAIFVERRKELFLEGQRFFDLKRTTRTINRTTNCTTSCTLLPAAREWNLPIPQSEIDANPAIVQNPNY